MEQTWPEKMTKTRKEMNDLDLPWGGGGAQVIEDEVADQTRWSTVHDLIFRLPGMPDDLAYQTSYSKGSTEIQDETPWEHEDAICTLVRKVSKVVETWTAEAQPRIEVCRLDPDKLVGIALCDDGSGSWVVMRLGEGEYAEPVGDEHGQIAYVDILDAAEVLKTGIVWKHDMSEDEPTDDPDSGPLEDVTDPDSGPLDLEPMTLPVILHTTGLLTAGVRIQYTATYRMRGTGNGRVTTFWAQPDSTRERLISLLRRALAHAAVGQGVKLSTYEIAKLIDPDSYVFDPPPSGADVDPLVATCD